jgi:hypothetical protein
LVVMRGTTRHQMIQRRVRITTPRDRNDVIDRGGRLDFADVQTAFAQRMQLQQKKHPWSIRQTMLVRNPMRSAASGLNPKL